MPAGAGWVACRRQPEAERVRVLAGMQADFYPESVLKSE